MKRFAVAAFVLAAACGPNQRNTGTVDAGDSGSGSGDSGSIAGTSTFVYAHTGSELYSVDPDTLALALVGAFQWPGAPDDMTDLAIDKAGLMIGISSSTVYRVDPATAATTRLSTFASGGGYNGMSFVPASAVGATGDDVLIATRNSDGKVFRIDPMTGVSTAAGNMGGAFSSSGDLVAVDGFGIVQTTPGDALVRLAPQTFAATMIGDIGFSAIYGIAFWKTKIFGFTDGGDFITIDPVTGHGTLVQHTSHEWYGAAVTTLAPVIQ